MALVGVLGTIFVHAAHSSSWRVLALLVPTPCSSCYPWVIVVFGLMVVVVGLVVVVLFRIVVIAVGLLVDILRPVVIVLLVTLVLVIVGLVVVILQPCLLIFYMESCQLGKHKCCIQLPN
jgi:hypothetical protein